MHLHRSAMVGCRLRGRQLQLDLCHHRVLWHIPFCSSIHRWSRECMRSFLTFQWTKQPSREPLYTQVQQFPSLSYNKKATMAWRRWSNKLLQIRFEHPSVTSVGTNQPQALQFWREPQTRVPPPFCGTTYLQRVKTICVTGGNERQQRPPLRLVYGLQMAQTSTPMRYMAVYTHHVIHKTYTDNTYKTAISANDI